MVNITSSSLIILAGALGGGGVIGYLLRILQKYQDRKDEIFLKTLPQLYYNLKYFLSITETFSKQNNAEEYIKKMESLKVKLNEILSSGAILPSIAKPRKWEKNQVKLSDLLEIDNDFERLLTYISKNKGTDTLTKLRETFSIKDRAKEVGLTVDLYAISFRVNAINAGIESSLDGYKSFSWKILVIVLLLGAALTAVELLSK